MSRRRNYSQEDFPLPWQLEAVFWLIGLLSVPIAMWWFINEITSPGRTLGVMLGVPVETQSLVDSFRVFIWIFPLLIGVRVRCALRRAVVDRLNRLV